MSAVVTKATLAAVGVGIATTIASFHYRHKAANVALANDTKLARADAAPAPYTNLDSVQESAAAHKSWAEKQAKAPEQQVSTGR